MERLGIRLFGKLSVDYAGSALQGCEAQKVQELLCYLLLHRNHPQPREILASILWGDNCTTAHSRKYLRNALWRLQSAMALMPEASRKQLLTAESDWIEFRSGPSLYLDIEEFEDAYGDVLGVSEDTVSEAQVERLEKAADLYIGYLLSGWSHDWCISERDRLHHVYLLVIEKIAGYYEHAGQFECGLSWAEGALTYDRAHESTHRRMMRLYYKMGYRTDALRQYHRCVAALKDELDVEPTQRTIDLYEALRQDRVGDLPRQSHAA